MKRVDRVTVAGRGKIFKISIVGYIATLMLALGGCVPHPPEPPVPFSLSLGSRGLEVTFCFGAGTITRLSASVRENTPDGWSDWSRISETAEGASIPFDYEKSLPLQVAIPSVSYRMIPEDALPESEFSVSVYFGFQYETGRSSYYNESFHVESAAQLSAEGYLYSDGTRHPSACEMDSARR